MFVLSPLAVSPVVVVVSSSSSSSSSSSGEKRSAPSFHRFAFVVKVLLFSSAATASFSLLLSFPSSRRRNLCSRLCARPRRPRRQKPRRSPTRGRRRSSVLPFRLRNALLDVVVSSFLSRFPFMHKKTRLFFLSQRREFGGKKVPQNNVFNWKRLLLYTGQT